MTGQAMGTWQPSMAPTHCGTPHFVKKPSTRSSSLLPLGNCMYLCRRERTMVVQVSWTISHTVERAIPNRWAIVRYSQGVARHHSVTATLFSTEIAFRRMVSCLRRALDNCWQRWRKVSLPMRKLSSQSLLVNVPKTISCHQCPDLEIK